MKQLPAIARKPQVWVPTVAIGLYALSRWWSAPTYLRLTQASGEGVLVQSGAVYAVFPSPIRRGPKQLTRLFIDGLDHLDVCESVSSVLGQLRGRWVGLNLPERSYGLHEVTPIYIDTSKLATVRPGTFRRKGAPSPMSELIFTNGAKVRVTEDAGSVQMLVG